MLEVRFCRWIVGHHPEVLENVRWHGQVYGTIPRSTAEVDQACVPPSAPFRRGRKPCCRSGCVSHVGRRHSAMPPCSLRRRPEQRQTCLIAAHVDAPREKNLRFTRPASNTLRAVLCHGGEAISTLQPLWVVHQPKVSLVPLHAKVAPALAAGNCLWPTLK